MSALAQLTSGLRRFGRERRNRELLLGASRAVLAGPAPLLLLALIDWLAPLPVAVLPPLAAIAALAGIVVGLRCLVPPLLRRFDAGREARIAERLHGRLDNLLIGGLQLGGELAAPGRPPAHSAALVELLVSRAAAQAVALRARDLLDARPLRRLGGAALAVLCAWTLLAAAAPSACDARWQRLGAGWITLLETLFPVRLTVEPGDVAVVRGSPVTLTVAAPGARRPTVQVVVDGATHELRLEGGRASFAIAKAEADVAYHFSYHGRDSAKHRIRVGDRPELTAISHEMTYPAYTGQPARTLAGRQPRLQALAGTGVLVSLAASTELHPELSSIAWADGQRQPLNVSGRFGHFGFTIEKPGRCTITLVGRLGRGFEAAQPIELDVAVDPDKAPTVDLRIRQERLTMLADEAMALVVPFIAEDDFGVAEVALEWKLDVIDAMLNRPTRNGGAARAIEPASERTVGRFADLFKGLEPPLQPGDRLRIELVAKDNNSETGPGLGRSRPLEIIIVRPDLGRFAERKAGLDAEGGLRGLAKLKRESDLLAEPARTVRAEKERKPERTPLTARQTPEGYPSGSEDAVGDYFRLLSGAKP